MPRDYNVLKAAIQAGESVRLRDGRMIYRVEDLPRAQTSDLRGRPMSEDEAGKVLDENETLRQENAQLKAGTLRLGSSDIPVPPVEPPADPDSKDLPPPQTGGGATVTESADLKTSPETGLPPSPPPSPSARRR